MQHKTESLKSLRDMLEIQFSRSEELAVMCANYRTDIVKLTTQLTQCRSDFEAYKRSQKLRYLEAKKKIEQLQRQLNKIDIDPEATVPC